MANGQQFIQTPPSLGGQQDTSLIDAGLFQLGQTLRERTRMQKIKRELSEASVENERADTPKTREQLGIEIAEKHGDTELADGFREQLRQNVTLTLERANKIEELHGFDTMKEFFNQTPAVRAGLLPKVTGSRTIDQKLTIREMETETGKKKFIAIPLTGPDAGQGFIVKDPAGKEIEGIAKRAGVDSDALKKGRTEEKLVKQITDDIQEGKEPSAADLKALAVARGVKETQAKEIADLARTLISAQGFTVEEAFTEAQERITGLFGTQPTGAGGAGAAATEAPATGLQEAPGGGFIFQ